MCKKSKTICRLLLQFHYSGAREQNNKHFWEGLTDKNNKLNKSKTELNSFFTSLLLLPLFLLPLVSHAVNVHVLICIRSLCTFHSSQPFTCAGLRFPAALKISNKHQLLPHDMKVFFPKKNKKTFCYTVCQVQTVLYINPATIQKQLDWWHDIGLLTQLRWRDKRFHVGWGCEISSNFVWCTHLCASQLWLIFSWRSFNEELFIQPIQTTQSLIDEFTQSWHRTDDLQSVMKTYLHIYVTLPKRPHVYQQMLLWANLSHADTKLTHATQPVL